mmetsp:Transcript_22708/g.49396  ORF Transcript_22708/g.49396 Transcript_22708/m.49396 type:complete len:284 (-) Transcript_22708:1945-2796(-)
MWSSIVVLSCLLAGSVQSLVPPGVARSGLATTGIGNTVAVKKPLFNSAGDGDDETYVEGDQDADSIARRDLIYNVIGAGLIGASGVASYSLFQSNVYTPSGMQRLPRTQFIAALGDPTASEGTIAEGGQWGIWPVDPGPRGVWLRDYKSDILESGAGKYRAPAGWTFDPDNWWVEEHGLIMEAPDFPLKEGQYLVTGGRMVTTTLTVEKDGRWKLDEGSLYDVTHLPCRSARYQPLAGGDEGLGSPTSANPKDFPVTPGAIMPSVPGTNKQDYAVLFVVGKAV